MIMFRQMKLQLINHLFSSGNKKTSEKILQLAIVNSLVMFRVVSLRSKKEREKTKNS